MPKRTPRFPSNLPEYARVCLQALTDADSDADFQRAILAVMTHLERIERHRPLSKIAESAQREEASAVRTWFRDVFLHAATDFLD